MRYLVELHRDPFGRRTLYRFTLNRDDRGPCLWCTSRLGRFSYGWEQDALLLKPVRFEGPYCGLKCYLIHTDQT